jgi:hypothetical protein
MYRSIPNDRSSTGDDALMAVDCIINDGLVCDVCGRPASCKEVRRNCYGFIGRRSPQTGEFLKRYIDLLGFEKKVGCKKCDEMLKQMNAWGPEGCRENRQKIIDHLKQAYKELTFTQMVMAMGKGVTTGLAFQLNPIDPIGSLVDRAIADAEAISQK